MRLGFERVHIELDWYDGPRSGLADVWGAVHYFQALHDYNHGDAGDDEYFVWPAGPDAFAMESESWQIYVNFAQRHDAGEVGIESHPGGGGVNDRYDELERLLAPHRVTPANGLRLIAEWRPFDRPNRSADSGPGYMVKWRRADQ
ncbi:hypothetical protein GCM10023193_51340 [Planotetraspora kaengkrachanensis]|uniref:Uncharacterized protein n=2 Tax=Planotetraspora kaengkrachanensis TaxID=575193 RepID=A0A8J3LXA0_9ACTN|nr:hypothetical protein Pka01_26710 [Planotetraspora kaengkrachanensis]